MPDKDRQYVYKKKLEKLQDGLKVPDAFLSDDEIEYLNFDYDTRAPGDYVVSGPLAGVGGGRGRVFRSAVEAEEWAKQHFGTRFRKRITDSERGGRWAMLIGRG